LAEEGTPFIGAMKVPAIRRRNSQNRAEVRRRSALEEGRALSYYAKEIAKKLIHPRTRKLKPEFRVREP
jgi:hypothetical protein